MKKQSQSSHQSSPFTADMLEKNSNMRPLIRMLAAQAVKNWLTGNPFNTATSTTQDGNEGNDLRTI